VVASSRCCPGVCGTLVDRPLSENFRVDSVGFVDTGRVGLVVSSPRTCLGGPRVLDNCGRLEAAMTKQRISPEAGFREASKDAEGRPLCRRCGGIVRRPRRSWCSAECVHEHKIRSSPTYARSCVFQRDSGVCALCGLDCESARKKYRALVRRIGALTHRYGDFGDRIHSALGSAIPFSVDQSFWAADHIVPVVEGGGLCGLDGYRTLCLRCHNNVTAELRKRTVRRCW